MGSQVVKYTDDERTVPCPLCDYYGARVEHLRQHMKEIHLLQRHFPCSLCGFKGFLVQDLIQHMVRHVGERRFSRRLRLYRGMRMGRHFKYIARHDYQWYFPCSLCDYSGYRVRHLIQHVTAKHVAERCFSCSLCSYKVSRVERLWEHLADHVGEEMTCDDSYDSFYGSYDSCDDSYDSCDRYDNEFYDYSH